MNRIQWRFPDALLFVSAVVLMFAAQVFCDKFFGSPANARQMLRYVLIVTTPGFACALILWHLNSSK